MIIKDVFPNKRSRNFVMNAGSRLKNLYHGAVQGDGSIKLVLDDVKDIQEEMNSFKRSTDIYNIISRMTPDQSMIYADQAQEYFDSIGMPKTYAEALQLIIDGQNHFEKLPVDIKQKFDNDFNKWFVTAGSEEWFGKHGVTFDEPMPVPSPTPIEEVKTE